MQHQTKNILITSASAKAPLVRAMKAAAVRAAPGSLVIAGDTDSQAPTRYLADRFWHMPRLTDITSERLLEECQYRDIGIVLPTRDGELPFWADARSLFARAGIDVIVSSTESIGRCLDKLRFAEFGVEHGLPFIPSSTEISEIEAETFVVKERFGAGSRLIGINLSLPAALEHARRLDDPIFQPFESGRELSIDGWMDKQGKPRGVVLRWRDRVVNGESQITTTFHDLTLEADALRVLQSLDLRGPAVVQAILTPSRKLRIIECNCRFGGASTASIAAGLEMLYWSLTERHDPSAEPVFERIEGDLRQVRLAYDTILYDSDF